MTYEEHQRSFAIIKSDPLLNELLECQLEYGSDEIQLAALVEVIDQKLSIHDMIKVEQDAIQDMMDGVSLPAEEEIEDVED